MPTIKDVTLTLTPISSSGFLSPIPTGAPISGETQVNALVKVAFEFADDEIGETFHAEVKLRGKRSTWFIQGVVYVLVPIEVHAFGHPAIAYVPYKEITVSSKQHMDSYQAQIQAKLLDEDLDRLFVKGVDLNGHLLLEWKAEQDEITAHVTLKHITFSGLSDQYESLQQTILVKTYG